jgi:hypothetical protein
MQYQTKHLSLVESTASEAYTSIGQTYDAAKGKALDITPGFVSNIVSNIEYYCKPVLNFGQKTAVNALLFADSTVRDLFLTESPSRQERVHRRAAYSRSTQHR